MTRLLFLICSDELYLLAVYGPVLALVCVAAHVVARGIARSQS